MRRLLLAAVAVVVAVFVPGTPAWAHAQLVSASPARDATVATAPATVELTFSERLNPDFTTIAISDAARRRITAPPPAVDSARATITPDRSLANGTYTVAYRVVSVDGHTVQGSYVFTVADPARPAATAQAVTAPPAAERGGVSPAVLIGAGVVTVLVLGVFVLRRRRAAGG